MLETGIPTTATVTGLAEGTTYFFAVTAYNVGGLESAHSSEVSYTVPGVPTVGSLQVTITPTAAGSAGGQWRVDDGADRDSGATASDLSAGSHVISFKTIVGYTTPADQTVTITVGQTTSSQGVYAAVSQTGSLQVTISPAGAVSAGAQWRVDGGAYQNSGAAVANLSTGSHVIAFNSVTGYTPPADQTVTVTADQTLATSGTYVNQTQSGALKIIMGPAGALAAGAQWRVDGGAFQNSGATLTNLSTGNHTISFKSVTGYIAPVTQTVTVVANQTKFSPGMYRPLSEGLFNEQLTFEDNEVSEGWTLVNESDNDNASVTAGHFETRPVDTRAGLIKAKTFPLSASRLKMEYSANVSSNYAEQATQIHLVMADGSVFLTSLAKADAGSQQMVVRAGTAAQSELARTFPLITGTYRVLAEFADGQIRYRVTKEGATTPLLDETVAVPNLQIHQLQFVRLFACTGTGEASWIDDVNIQALTADMKDFDRDGNADIIWQDKVTGQRGIWFMNGTTHTGAFFLPTVPIAWQIAGTGDFNADGQADIIWENSATGERGVWFMNGTTLIDVRFLPTVPIAWEIAGTGDFNADGQTDIIWQNSVTGERGVWFMNGTTLIDVRFLPTVPIAWEIAGTGDFNADGQTDIIWQNKVTGERGIWFMNGTTHIGVVFLPTVPLAWEIAGTGDFNGDSQPDILWQNTNTGQRVIWLMNGPTFLADKSLPTIATQWEIRNK